MIPKIIWISVYCTTLIWSAIEPVDRFTWFLEAVPALIAAVLLMGTRRSFPLTPLLYILILAHCVILLIGAHYTYAQVPLFESLKDVVGFQRNNYDKLGHFAQGFVPAILAREILLRKHIVAGRYWLSFIVLSICLAFSAFYELIEWWVALATGENAEAFLGTQGYQWDTQSDMAFALVGAISALFALPKIHDRQIGLLCSSAERAP